MSKPLVPRFEQVAAIWLAVACFAPWVALVVNEASPWELPLYLARSVSNLVRTLHDGSWSMGSLTETAVEGLVCGLFTTLPVILVQAILRACCRVGFLRGVSMWYWTAGHALLSIVMVWVYGWDEATDFGFVGIFVMISVSFVPALLIAAGVIWRLRRERARASILADTPEPST